MPKTQKLVSGSMIITIPADIARIKDLKGGEIGIWSIDNKTGDLILQIVRE